MAVARWSGGSTRPTRGAPMISDGLLAAARALRYWETRQQVLAHNLANVDTPGFKGERVFARLVEDRLVEAHSATDMSTGPLSPTGRPLDLALEGPEIGRASCRERA